MLKTHVKASAVTNLTDARYFAALGVEWIGFNFDKAADTSIHPHTVIAIKEWIEGVKLVGEFHQHSMEEVLKVIEMIGLDAIQFNSIPNMPVSNIPVLQEIVINASTTVDNLKKIYREQSPHVHSFLLNFKKNGYKWEMLEKRNPIFIQSIRQLCPAHPTFIGIDFSPENVNAVLKAFSPYGIEVQGGQEEKTGYKSFDDLDTIFEALEADD